MITQRWEVPTDLSLPVLRAALHTGDLTLITQRWEVPADSSLPVLCLPVVKPGEEQQWGPCVARVYILQKRYNTSDPGWPR
jgi:hypothetical protein